MEFSEPKGIYIQIADQVCLRVLQGEWLPEQRIPSIRELAIELGVNPNTVTKSYQVLLDREVIISQRGKGYFVCKAANSNVVSLMKEEFIKRDLPKLLKTMELLGIGMSELESYILKLTK